ncbi:GMP synthase [Methanobrevibacter cuticularis]|uniref:GMP synthase [glutamine-hydrolyzing] subunit A n=1 Tax=Methanobrevibacter cuticularis TaxID=47311 RepID=A0A166E624_9EURY|nr:GMP synthase subunit A [Methanobrevibacter cuticularis]KZX16319.1 GMP synthase [Methanobrevibacter cuticularis]
MTILVINNKGQYNHRIGRSLKYLNIPSELVSNELTIEEIKEKNPIGMILGGGPSLEESGNSLNYLNKLDIPILGICLGHQLIAKSFGGTVSTSSTESYAQIEINVLEENKLFKGLFPSMQVWTSHKDEVKSLPDEFKILASSPICKIEAMKHKTKDIYGIQFHPEVHHTPKGGSIFKNFYDICNYDKK